MIKYIGSKRTLIPFILNQIPPSTRTVLDLFSGTARVGHALKRAGFRVYSNDLNTYAATLARCYVGADRERVEHDARALIREFNQLPGSSGWFTDTYCSKSRFFQPHNGEKVDNIRDEISRKGLGPELEAVLLVSLMEAADRVDSTCGVQMAFLKQWAPRSFNPIELRMPDLLPAVSYGLCEVFQRDACELVLDLPEVDVTYLDPPYNQHNYLGNYHIWESLVLWDKPKTYGVAQKRLDVKTRKSDFNSKRKFKESFQLLIENLKTKRILVSFNDEGYLNREDFETILSRRGEVRVQEFDYKRYVGAQIGIHNPKGHRVGKVSHTRNKEFLFDCQVYPQ